MNEDDPKKHRRSITLPNVTYPNFQQCITKIQLKFKTYLDIRIN